MIGHQHDPLAAEDDVVAVVRLIDLLDIELDGAHVAEPAGLGPPISNGRHLRGDIRENDLALRPYPLRGRDSEAARPAGELEHPVAGFQRRGLEHPPGKPLGSAVDEVRVVVPARGHGAPHRVQAGPELIDVSGRRVLCLLSALHDQISLCSHCN